MQAGKNEKPALRAGHREAESILPFPRGSARLNRKISERALQHVELLPQFRDLLFLGIDLRMKACEFGQGRHSRF